MEKQEEITAALKEEAIDEFPFKEWFRSVKWRYSNHPLCTLGSLQDPGGRFNYGDLNFNCPKFSALYIARDGTTARDELLIHNNSSKESGLTSEEKNLTIPSSLTSVCLNGVLDSVFDLRGNKKLSKLMKIFKKSKFSTSLREREKSLIQQGLIEKKQEIFQHKKALHDSFFEKDWRKHPALYELPSNSQIFGHMVYSAGITGILYYSTRSDRRVECLSIFPQNFKNSTSYINLKDPPPNKKIPIRIDSSNFAICEENFKEDQITQ